MQLDNEELQINYLQKSIDLNTNDPMVYYNMSLVYSKKNELQNALKYIKKGLEQFPSEISLINLDIPYGLSGFFLISSVIFFSEGFP